MKKTFNRIIYIAFLLCAVAGSFALAGCTGAYTNPNMGGSGSGSDGFGGGSIPAELVGTWAMLSGEIDLVSGSVSYYEEGDAFEIRQDGTGKVFEQVGQEAVDNCNVIVEGNNIVFKKGTKTILTVSNYSLSNNNNTLEGVIPLPLNGTDQLIPFPATFNKQK